LNEPTIIYESEPFQVSLGNAERIRKLYDVSPKTLIDWHDRLGFPVVWPSGRGPGKVGYVPTREARALDAEEARDGRVK
jgi:hypothetical protein